jgi:hypothetical protein
MAAASPAGAPSPSLSPTRAEAEPCLALFLLSTPLTHLHILHPRARAVAVGFRPPPPVLPRRFTNPVDLQDERASPRASPSRATPPQPLPVTGDPLEPHCHRGPPPAAAILHHRPFSRPSLSKVKISKCSPSSSLHFPLFTRAPRALGHRRRRSAARRRSAPPELCPCRRFASPALLPPFRALR